MGLFEEDNRVDLLQGDLEAAVADYARTSERSRQRSVGPSELGQGCERRLALTLLGAEPVNLDRDEWTSSVGTAIHLWMKEAFLHANTILAEKGKPARWLCEQTVTIETGLDGHCDLYDLWTHTVVDHKFPGVTSIRKYRKQGHPGKQYIWQAHVYGYGWARLGFPVRRVAIAMYPRSGLIRDTWLWDEPYNPAIAREALDRKDKLLVALNVAEENYDLATFMDYLERDTEFCDWCPYYDRNSTDPTLSCKGPWYDPNHHDPRDMKIPGILA